MSWRTTFVKHVGAGGLTGTTFGDWINLLRSNHFAVDARYWPRAAFVTSNSFLNSLLRRYEDHRYGAEIERTSIPPPLFILGIWRSGTTHLHNLLAQDDRFAYPNTYQVLYPHTFLTTERAGARFMQAFMPPTRPMDNVKSGTLEPQEDEFALVACGLSFMEGTVIFPRSTMSYRQFLTLRDATAVELGDWTSAFMRFLRKLTLKYRRPLILKSPAHTGRVKVLLRLFPDAKFVHIHRHPYAVFQSSVHTMKKVAECWSLQTSEIDDEQIIRDTAEIFDAFFADRPLIPLANYCEVAFDDLERDPIGQIKRIYESLDLPHFEHIQSNLNGYVRGIAGYSKNEFPQLPTPTCERIANEWSQCFEEWGYPR